MARLIVEKEKVASNVLKIKETVAPARVIGVVKGNGYGLGLAGFAALLRQNGVDMFAVARLEEGLALRESGIQEDILLMTPAPMPAEAEAVIENGLIATVSCHDDAVVLNGLAEAHGKKARAHVKIDSGFGRYGFLPAEADKILPIFDFLQSVGIEGIYTHFSNAFARDDKTVREQFVAFQFALDTLAAAGADCGMRHAAGSCAALRFDYTRLDAVRIGSALLGRLPVKNVWDLKKVGFLEGRIVETKLLPPGHNVGYANVFTTKRETRVAVIDAGYCQGFGVEKSRDTFRFRDVLRYMWNDGKSLFGGQKYSVLIRGRRAPLVGRISLCNIVADVSGIECSAGDAVILPVNPLFVDSAVEREYV